MIAPILSFVNGSVFDGQTLHHNVTARFENKCLVSLDANTLPPRSDERVIDLDGDLLSPGYVDLQVNGGGGLLLNDDPSPETLARIVKAHRSLGAVRILPTLITDTPETTRAAIEAAAEAMTSGLPGMAGLHLEGPHLSQARKGAHDAAYIRPMTPDDLTLLLEAKTRLPVLKVTVAPETVTEDQIRRLAEAGILVSLGHSDADFETCRRAITAGAQCVTHLFNAMSQMGNREPGLVGAALTSGTVSAGLIADGFHVHPETMRTAWLAKQRPEEKAEERIFLVSDAMAVAGTDLSQFHLQGRLIQRRDQRLTLEDGTLAGADLDLTRAIRTLVETMDVPLPDALRSATTIPATLIGFDWSLSTNGTWPIADFIRISKDLSSAQPLDSAL